MSTPIAVKTRFPWLRRLLQIEQAPVFVGLVVCAMLASLGQKPSLLIILLSILTMGNLVIPLAFAARRIYAGRSFPWNRALWLPVRDRGWIRFRRRLRNSAAIDQD